MGGARTIAILLTVAALCAAVISGCGGGDDSSTSTATTAEAGGQTETTTSGGGESTSPKQGEGGQGGSESGSGGGSSEAGGGSEITEEPAPHERSYKFRTPGGDNSIQSFGDEGGGSDRSEATEIVTALFKALESGNWNTVCNTYLSKGNLEEIEALAEKSPQVKGKSCSQILGSLNTTPGEKSPDTPDEGVASLRTEGEVGFAIYRGIDGKGYAVPLKLEGGKWKLTALAPTPLGS